MPTEKKEQAEREKQIERLVHICNQWAAKPNTDRLKMAIALAAFKAKYDL